jgi:hypothetical protein
MRLALVVWGWRATAVGLAAMALGAVAVLVASWQGMQVAPGLTLVDGYWIGLLPWMGVGPSLIGVGSLVVLVAGVITVVAFRWHPLVRLLALAAAAPAAFYWLVVGLVGVPRMPSLLAGTEVGTALYSAPEAAATFVIAPTLIVAAFAAAGRRRLPSSDRLG